MSNSIMDFEGKPCGICGTKLGRIVEEVSPGVRVDAYKCRKGHISYSEEVMRQVEAMGRDKADERRVVKIGSSVAVPIPAKIAKALGLTAKTTVFVRSQDNTVIIRPSQM